MTHATHRTRRDTVKTPLIVAHRGASHDAPENTLAAFEMAWQQQADAIEGDFRLTQDGRIVCMHDATTQRVGNIPLTVAESSLAELQTVDIGSWKHPRFAGERIATLEDVWATVPSGKHLYIEIKTGNEIIPALLQAFQSTSLSSEQIIVIAFDAEVIRAVKRNRPDIRAHLLVHFKRDHCKHWHPAPAAVLQELKRIAADGLSTHCDRFIDHTFVATLKHHGWQYHTWTVDTVPLAHHFTNIGADSITSNRPGWLKACLNSQPTE